ncbi:DNA-3-methyladenine glycosylase [Candidatus Parcubacteria bacterium]|nr:DNA-3-methyladenine glycosylase [Candidatus Parcubacteria bacterium]
MHKILGYQFFDRPTLTVAKDLIGKFLVRKIGNKEIALMITETEAYDGLYDLACHARSGKTKRNYPMFGEAGRAYVYFTYGMHWMLNLVTGKKDYPAGVLIRGLQGSTLKLNGPAKLTKFLKIDVKLNNLKLGKGSGLWVEDRGVKIPTSKIKRTPRIGVAYAGSYAKKPWRFVYLSG